MRILTEVEAKVGRSPAPFPTVTRPDREDQDHPAFTVAFSPSTPMRDIHDAVIQTVLRFTQGNRARAAELLQINPRTIRRHLGRKAGSHAAALAG